MSTVIRILGSVFAALAVVFALAGTPLVVSAQGLDTPPETTENKCAEGEPTSKCKETSNSYVCTDSQATKDCVDNNPIVKWLQFFINVLSVVILAGSAIMVAVAGIQYTMSRDNPQAVQAAKQKMYNIALGLGVYFFLYAFVQWLVPGGVF